MKKLLASMLCLALAASVVLSSCDDKKDEKKKNEETNLVEEVVEEVVEYPVPEAQLDYEYEINSFDMVAKITAYTGEGTNVVVPATITDPVYGDVVPVTTIGTYAFAENEKLEAVILPETVTVIEKGAFQSCPELRAVSLPFGLETIEANAFYNSNKVEKLGYVLGNEPTEEMLAAWTNGEEIPRPEIVVEEVEAEEAAEEAEVEATEETEEAEEAVVEEVKLFELIGNQFPVTVKKIGFMAFSSQLNEIAWYKALTDDVVTVGDGILLKFYAEADYTMDESIKSVAYYAFSNVGPVKVTVVNPEIEIDDNAIFMSDKALTFAVPEAATELAAKVKSCGASYELYAVETEEAVEGEAAEGEETAEVTEEATEEVAA